MNQLFGSIFTQRSHQWAFCPRHRTKPQTMGRGYFLKGMDIFLESELFHIFGVKWGVL